MKKELLSASGVALMVLLAGCANEQPVVTDAVVAVVAGGQSARSLSMEELSLALREYIFRSITAKAKAGKFYKRYRIPEDSVIERLAGQSLSPKELEMARGFAEAHTRDAEREIAYPAWRDAIIARGMPPAEKAFEEGKFEAAREATWYMMATGVGTDVPEVAEPVWTHGQDFLLDQVNPTEWSKIQLAMRDRVVALEKAKQYDEAVAYLQSVPHIRVYSKVLNRKLNQIKAEAVRLEIPEAELTPIFDQTAELLKRLENICSFIDEPKVESKVSQEQKQVILDALDKQCKEFVSLLKRYSATEANAEKTVGALKSEVVKLLDGLDAYATTTTTTTKRSLRLGTNAVNVRIDAYRDRLTKWVTNRQDLNAALDAEFAKISGLNVDALCAWVEAKCPPNITDEFDGARKLLKEDVEAIIIAPATEVTTVSSTDLPVPSALDLVLAREVFRSKIYALVKAGKFDIARKAIWTQVVPDEATPYTTFIAPVAKELMNEVVNPAEWAVIEAKVRQDVGALLQAGDTQGAEAYLKGVSHVQIYPPEIDAALSAVAAEAIGLGTDKEKVDAAVQANTEKTPLQKDIVDFTDKAGSLRGKRVKLDHSAYNNLLQAYRNTMAKRGLTEENADKLAKAFAEMLKPFVPTHVEQPAEATLTLGGNALNARIDKLIAEMNEQIAEARVRLTAEAEALTARMGELEAAVKEALAGKDFPKARTLIHDVEPFGKPELDTALYIHRIGLLDNLVNPQHLKLALEDLAAKFKAAEEAADYSEFIAFVKGYDYVAEIDDAQLAAIEQLKHAVLDLPVSNQSTEAIRQQIVALCNDILANRTSPARLVPEIEAVKAALAQLDAAMKAQLNQAENPAAAAALDLILKAWAAEHVHPVTTAMLNQTIAARIAELLPEAEARQARLDAIRAYKELVAKIDSEVSFDTQIALAEETIAKLLASGSTVNNKLLGEYARVFRLLKKEATLSADQATTMLLGAAYLGQNQVLPYALELGAAINGTSERDPLTRNALLLALDAQRFSTVRQLLEQNAEVAVADAKGNSALHYATRTGSIPTVRALAKAGAPLVANADGCTPLFIAVAVNNVALTEELLKLVAEEERADFVNLRNKADLSAIELAAKCGSRDVLEPLALAGAEYGPRTLILAQLGDHIAVAQWLIAQGVDVNAQGVMEAACPATATGLFLMREGGVGQHACAECTPQVKPEAPAAVEPTPQAQPVKVSVILEPEAEK